MRISLSGLLALGMVISGTLFSGAVARAGEQVYFFHNDHLGTPQAMTDSTGRIVWTAEYDPFGKATVNEDPDGDGQTVTNNLRFPGQYYDAETGLHYNWNRYYDPGTGRYLQTDPIGLDGGLNLYAYAQNSPVNYVDPTGENWLRIGQWFANSTYSQRLAQLATSYGQRASTWVARLRCGAEDVTATAEQLANASQVYRNGPLTNIGRALTKHPNVIGESGNVLQSLGGAANVNNAAARALENIIQNGAMTTKMTKAFGQVVEYRLPSGIGARFSATTNEFIGFLGRGQ